MLPEAGASAVAVELVVPPGERLWVKEKFLQASDEGVRKKTRYLLDWRVPFTCFATGLVGLIGGAAGLVFGHLMAFGVSAGMEAYLGEGIEWYLVTGVEWVYLAAVVALAALAGLVPAMKAYKTSVAANLVAV